MADLDMEDAHDLEASVKESKACIKKLESRIRTFAPVEVWLHVIRYPKLRRLLT